MEFINKIAIIGVGLLGGSIGLTCKKKFPHIRVNGIGRSQEKLQQAVKLNIIDNFYLNVRDGVKDCDLVIICTPVKTIHSIFQSLLPCLKNDALVTDVGSTKDEIIKNIDTIPNAHKHFIGSHPMTGSEQSGMEAAKDDLYQDSLVIITENQHSNPEASNKVDIFWQSLGARTKHMDSETHDRVVCYTSHLPHLIASNLAYTLSQRLTNDELNQKTFGNGLLDTTRIAEGDPAMWLDIFMSNQDNLLLSIQNFKETLNEIEQLILNNQAEDVYNYLSVGKKFRIEIAN